MTVIVLAAGLSSRMGCSKLLLPYRGNPLIACTIGNILPYTDRIIAVTGHDADAVSEAIRGLHVRTVYAGNYMKGQKYSLLSGVEAAGDDDFAVLPGDLPLIGADDFAGTERALEGHEAARAMHSGIPGHPVMFRSRCRDGLLRFPGTMMEYMRTLDVGFHSGSIGCIYDIDTPERYRDLLAGVRESRPGLPG